MNLGKAIKLCRTQKDLNQSELAEKAGISISYLSLLEQGKRDPNFSTIQSIASALNIPVGILTFLASKEEIRELSPEVAEKLSYIILGLIGETTGAKSKVFE